MEHMKTDGAFPVVLNSVLNSVNLSIHCVTLRLIVIKSTKENDEASFKYKKNSL